MRKFLAVLLLSALATFSCTTLKKDAPKKSSEIPARREFPVDPSVNPCENFYGYACNNVVDSFALREDRSAHTFSFSDSAERMLKAKQQYLADLKDKTKLSPRAHELKDVYQACMDTGARSEEERKLMASTKDQLAKIKSRRDFQKLVASNITSADVAFISFGPLANHDNPDWYDVFLLSGLNTLPEHSYYDDAAIMADFRSLLTTFFKTAGIDKPEAHADALIEFEKGFMKTYPKPAQLRELFSRKSGIKRADFLKKYPNLMMDDFFKKLPKFTHLRDMTPDNYRYVNDSLAKADLDTLKSIYLFHELSDYMDDAYPEYFAQKFAFNQKHLGGPNARPTREERCTRMVMSRFTKEIDAELVDVIFPKFPTDRIVSLSEKVRNAIVKGINENKWLSPAGKANAARKIRTANLMLVKPRNNEEWDFNPAIDYNPKTPIANQKNLEKATNDKALDDMKRTRNRRRWSMGPLTVNAYYSPSNNQFVMPVGILQYPFYDPNLPEKVNLGAVGAVVGHELGHAIDDKGSRYDEKGRLIAILSDQDLAEFKKRTNGFVSQFAALGYDGNLALGENIGDHVGVSFAYDAAFGDGKGTLDEKKAFFLQYARLWCNVMRPKYRELQMKTDPHPMGDARVNEQVKHQPGFAEAFSCKEGDAMVLKDRIRVW